jgi:hypothetical protein
MHRHFWIIIEAGTIFIIQDLRGIYNHPDKLIESDIIFYRNLSLMLLLFPYEKAQKISKIKKCLKLFQKSAHVKCLLCAIGMLFKSVKDNHCTFWKRLTSQILYECISTTHWSCHSSNYYTNEIQPKFTTAYFWIKIDFSLPTFHTQTYSTDFWVTTNANLSIIINALYISLTIRHYFHYFSMIILSVYFWMIMDVYFLMNDCQSQQWFDSKLTHTSDWLLIIIRNNIEFSKEVYSGQLALFVRNIWTTRTNDHSAPEYRN